MLTLRPSNERGYADHGWLKSNHSFSFASYIDPRHRGFRSLRVINDDVIAGGGGFPTHPHDNMEIFSYAVEGRLSHKDSHGHQATIGRGEVQFMSAGSGIAHSEFNASESEPMRLLQIWLFPTERNTEPRYEDRDFTEALDSGKLVLLLDSQGRDGSIRIGTDARIYGARPKAGTEYDVALEADRGAWLQVVNGELDVNGHALKKGDGLAAEEEDSLRIKATADAEFILFDLA